ncbi:hypothetical protein D9M70_436200 [compost metagenome]
MVRAAGDSSRTRTSRALAPSVVCASQRVTGESSGSSGSGVTARPWYWRVFSISACNAGGSGCSVRYCQAGTDDRKITPWSSLTISGSAPLPARWNHSRLSLTTVTPMTLPLDSTGCAM